MPMYTDYGYIFLRLYLPSTGIYFFKNGGSSYSCGQSKAEGFKYDNVISYISVGQSIVLVYSYEGVTTTRKRYVLILFFLNEETNIRF